MEDWREDWEEDLAHKLEEKEVERGEIDGWGETFLLVFFSLFTFGRGLAVNIALDQHSADHEADCVFLARAINTST